MKKLFFIFFAIFAIITNLNAGTLRGAWQMLAEPNSKQKVVMQATIDYLSIAVFEENQYIRSYGGPYSITEEAGTSYLHLKLEFNDKQPEMVGEAIKYKLDRMENEFSIDNQLKTNWKRIDLAQGELAGLWRITARANASGEMAEMKQGARKTIKIITGTRFQWLAINPETKEFSGTGGGTFTLENGKYTEKLEFFSRDNTRVGASLTFEAKVSDNQWHHSGKSSKGDPVSEIWTKK
jgi:hypothetical protein